MHQEWKERVYDAVAIGASAGGLDALKAVLAKLPVSFPCPIVVAQHVHPESNSQLSKYLNEATELRVKEADDKERVRSGCVYIAPSNYHLLVEWDCTLALTVDGKVNSSRPSIDVLFESAAHVWGERLIGVVLTGASDDGAKGACDIKRHGGFLIAQDPDTAEHSTMPRAAIKAAEIQVIPPVVEIADHILRITSGHARTMTTRTRG